MQANRIILVLLLLVFSSGILTAKGKPTKPYCFIQITDPQFGMFENNVGFEKETELYEKAVKEINRLKPDFVVITGDLVNNLKDAKQLSEFKRITSKVDRKIPVYFTPGNHDVGNVPDSASLTAFISNYGYDHFAFKHKNSLFIGFNSSIIKNNLPQVEKKQYDWLVRSLTNGKKAAHIILFGHYPFFLKSEDEPEEYANIGIENRRKYLALFAKNSVEAIFSGHFHDNAISRYGKIELVTTSAVGKPLGSAPSGFRIVKVYPNRIEHIFYGLTEIPETITYDQNSPVK